MRPRLYPWPAGDASPRTALAAKVCEWFPRRPFAGDAVFVNLAGAIFRRSLRYLRWGDWRQQNDQKPDKYRDKKEAGESFAIHYLPHSFSRRVFPPTHATQ